MKVICIANQKGGIGKTTTATATASILKKKGFKTLLIDSDMQGNSSDTYGAVYDGVATLYDVLFDEETPIEEAIQKTEKGDIISFDPLLREADDKLKNMTGGEYILSEKIMELKDYDYIIIDTAPALNKLLLACLMSADSVVIPITADRYALQGISQLFETLNLLKKRYRKEVKIDGFLLVKYNERMNISKEVKTFVESISTQYDTKLFNSKIRECGKTREAQAAREMLIEYAPKCTTAEDYESFVNELILTNN